MLSKIRAVVLPLYGFTLRDEYPPLVELHKMKRDP